MFEAVGIGRVVLRPITIGAALIACITMKAGGLDELACTLVQLVDVVEIEHIDGHWLNID